MSEFEHLTLRELKKELKKASLPTHGNKNDLRQRLILATTRRPRQQNEDADFDDGAPPPPLPLRTDQDQDLRADIKDAEDRVRLLRLRKEAADLEAALGLRMPAHTANGELQMSAAAIAGAVAGVQEAHAGSQGRKLLLIPDFVEPRDVSVVRSQARESKKFPEQISVGQWVSANSSILQQMISSGDLIDWDNRDCSKLSAYLAYTKQIGDLVDGGYRFQDVLRYDDSFRRLQHETGRRWNEESFQLLSRHLLAPGSSQASVNQRTGSQKPGSRQQICLLFNRPQGCRFGATCKFQHACAICKGEHPAADHAKN